MKKEMPSIEAFLKKCNKLESANENVQLYDGTLRLAGFWDWLRLVMWTLDRELFSHEVILQLSVFYRSFSNTFVFLALV